MKPVAIVSMALAALLLPGCKPAPALPPATAQAAPVCPPPRILSATATASGGEVFTVSAEVYDQQACAHGLRLPSWEVYDPARTFIGRITARWNGQEVYVPLSAYGDLGDVEHMAAAAKGDGIVVTLDSLGEAEWKAELEVRKGRVTRRKVWGADVPDSNEETVYRYFDN